IQTDFKSKESCPRIILQLVCSNLFFACKHAVEEQGGELEAILESPVQAFRSVISQPSIGHMFDYLTPILTAMLDYRDALHNNQFTKEIENAKKYIQNNFRDLELSLDTVAKYVNMSACYFSVIFKKESGSTFISYLTNVRIDKAKELLLSTNLKSYEISYQVGYDNPTYFSTVFKKLTGVSPIDYKKNQRP
ncbi:MAG TPA: helix-turn-helix domain-containing protein, partial [Anaerovoracaceae bacterium]|nr:helix-turn-helix domain-containing protein [Anaerovoracaceae bacterium]